MTRPIQAPVSRSLTSRYSFSILVFLTGPFDGVLGFSQGAVLASMVCQLAAACQAQQNVENSPLATHLQPPVFAALCSLKFGVMVSGFLHPLPSNDNAVWYGRLDDPPSPITASASSSPSSPSNLSAALRHPSVCAALTFSSKMQFPTMHVWGRSDMLVEGKRSEEIANLYADPFIYTHAGGHVLPQTAADTPQFIQFVSRFIPAPENGKKKSSNAEEKKAPHQDSNGASKKEKKKKEKKAANEQKQASSGKEDKEVSKPHILFLHGWGQNGQVFATRTQRLRRKLETQLGVVCLYPAAPYLIEMRPLDGEQDVAGQKSEAGSVGEEKEEKQDVAAATEEAKQQSQSAAAKPAKSGSDKKKDQTTRGWYYFNEKDPSAFQSYFATNAPTTYIGLLATLRQLSALFQQHNIVAVVGFSQGSVLASLLSFFSRVSPSDRAAVNAALMAGEKQDHEAVDISVFASIRCGLFMSGFLRPSPLQLLPFYPYPAASSSSSPSSSSSADSTSPNASADKPPLSLPSLHVYGRGDEFVSRDKTLELIALYDQADVYVHGGKHVVPAREEDQLRMLDFIRKHM